MVEVLKMEDLDNYQELLICSSSGSSSSNITFNFSNSLIVNSNATLNGVLPFTTKELTSPIIQPIVIDLSVDLVQPGLIIDLSADDSDDNIAFESALQESSKLTFLSKLLDDSMPEHSMPKYSMPEHSMPKKRSRIEEIEDEDIINALIELKSSRL
jgi:hypothetical protein